MNKLTNLLGLFVSLLLAFEINTFSSNFDIKVQQKIKIANSISRYRPVNFHIFPCPKNLEETFKWLVRSMMLREEEEEGSNRERDAFNFTAASAIFIIVCVWGLSLLSLSIRNVRTSPILTTSSLSTPDLRCRGHGSSKLAGWPSSS